MLFEYADCVGEGRCVCIGTQESDGFSFHQSLEDTPGVGRRKMEILESVSRLEVCFEVLEVGLGKPLSFVDV